MPCSRAQAPLGRLNGKVGACSAEAGKEDVSRETTQRENSIESTGSWVEGYIKHASLQGGPDSGILEGRRSMCVLSGPGPPMYQKSGPVSKNPRCIWAIKLAALQVQVLATDFFRQAGFFNMLQAATGQDSNEGLRSVCGSCPSPETPARTGHIRIDSPGALFFRGEPTGES